MKIVTSLQDNDSNGSDNGDREQCLHYIKAACTLFTCGTGFHPFSLDLISKGAISLLLQGLDTDQMPTSDSEIISTIDTLTILYNCVKCPDSIVRSTYRTANAVAILMKHLESKEMMVIMTSLSILACIINSDVNR